MKNVVLLHTKVSQILCPSSICLHSFHLAFTHLPELSPYLFSIHHNFETLETFIYFRHWLFSRKKNKLLFFC